jgi:hypothetical protein
MLFDGIFFSLIVGFLRKGSIKGFMQVKIKHGWVFPLLLAFQFSMYYLQTKIHFLAQISSVSFMVMYVVGIVFLWLNRDQVGFPILLAGVFLNFLVMLVNGGRMPVSLEAANLIDPSYAESLTKGVLYGKHQLMTNSTRLGLLGDIIPLTKPYYKQQVISIGDAVMCIGIFNYVQSVMLAGKKDYKRMLTAEQV